MTHPFIQNIYSNGAAAETKIDMPRRIYLNLFDDFLQRNLVVSIPVSAIHFLELILLNI